MVRFARSTGSKASNERVPEEATSWSTMKQQMEEKKQESEQNIKRKEFEAVRKSNYNMFLQEIDATKQTEWADIPSSKTVHALSPRKMAPNINDKKGKEIDSKVKPAMIVSSKKTNKRIRQLEKRRRLRAEKREKDEAEKREKEEEAVNNSSNDSDQKGKSSPLKQHNNKEYKSKKRGNNEAVVNKSTNVSDEKRKISPKQSDQSDNEGHKRQKTNSVKNSMNINGVEVELSYFNGFPIKKDDAARLSRLRHKMISKGIPRSKIRAALKLEQRRAEKALAREKKNVCYNCRKSGHLLADCPTLDGNAILETTGIGICFKCGSTEHTHFECKVVRGEDYKFATCFICKEQGHISKQCPDNQRGLYPKGGCCKVCGDVTHLKMNCPKYQAQQESVNMTLDTLKYDDIESLGGERNETNVEMFRPSKVVKF